MNHRNITWPLTALCSVVALMLTWTSTVRADCLLPAANIAGAAATTDVVDVQCEILMTLWELSGGGKAVPKCLDVAPVDADLDCDGNILITDVLLIVALTLQSPWSPVIDSNGNYCADACEKDSDGDGVFDLEDCAPHIAAVHLGAAEVCNGWDDDCDGTVDAVGLTPVTAGCDNSNPCAGVKSCAHYLTNIGVVFSEILIEPGFVSDAKGEWVELYNASPNSVDINGWTLSSASLTFYTISTPTPFVIPPYGYVVLARNKSPSQNGGVMVDYQISGMEFDNTADTITLTSGLGTKQDSLSYSSGSSFPHSPGISTAVISLTGGKTGGKTWGLSTHTLPSGIKATPGGPNIDVSVPPACVLGPPPSCDDGKACTLDVCLGLSECAHIPRSGTCGNASTCNGAPVCKTASTKDCVSLSWPTVGTLPNVCGESDGLALGGCSGALSLVLARISHNICCALGHYPL